MKLKNILKQQKKIHKEVKKACSSYIIHGTGNPIQVHQSVTISASMIGGLTGIECYKDFDFSLVNHTQKINISLNLNSSKNREMTPPQKRAKNLIQYFQQQLNSVGGI